MRRRRRLERALVVMPWLAKGLSLNDVAPELMATWLLVDGRDARPATITGVKREECACRACMARGCHALVITSREEIEGEEQRFRTDAEPDGPFHLTPHSGGWVLLFGERLVGDDAVVEVGGVAGPSGHYKLIAYSRRAALVAAAWSRKDLTERARALAAAPDIDDDDHEDTR